MLYSVKILKEGDKVLNVWDGKIAILRSNGEVDIYGLIFEKGQLPRLSEDVFKITYGNETIEISNRGVSTPNSTDIDDEDDDFVISIKSPKK